MKITKQTAYRHTVAQRAMRMEEIVAWVKDEPVFDAWQSGYRWTKG